MSQGGRLENTMATRERAFCIALFGAIATATAQNQTTPEKWTPIGRPAQTTTGHVTFTPIKITFQNGKSSSVDVGGQMLFRPEAKSKQVMSDFYRVSPSDDPVLEDGTRLCKGKPIAYVLVWKSEAVRKEANSRTLAPFSGPKFSVGSPDDCGRYTWTPECTESQCRRRYRGA